MHRCMTREEIEDERETSEEMAQHILSSDWEVPGLEPYAHDYRAQRTKARFYRAQCRLLAHLVLNEAKANRRLGL